MNCGKTTNYWKLFTVSHLVFSKFSTFHSVNVEKWIENREFQWIPPCGIPILLLISAILPRFATCTSGWWRFAHCREENAFWQGRSPAAFCLFVVDNCKKHLVKLYFKKLSSFKTAKGDECFWECFWCSMKASVALFVCISMRIHRFQHFPQSSEFSYRRSAAFIVRRRPQSCFSTSRLASAWLGLSAIPLPCLTYSGVSVPCYWGFPQYLWHPALHPDVAGALGQPTSSCLSGGKRCW